MRKLLLITAVVYLFCGSLRSQSVTFECEEKWGPGRYNKVTLKIDFGREYDFARLTQNFPVGFDVIPDKLNGADFSFSGDKLNIVWITIPSSRATLSYFIRPDRSMNGNFTLSGEMVIVRGGSSRSIIRSQDLNISVSGNNGLLAEEVKSTLSEKDATNVARQTEETRKNDKAASPARTIYRVQVATSSSQFTQNEIERRLGCDIPGKMVVVRVGNLYKYQFGSFSDYKSASNLLENLVSKGVKDAFVVAYRGDQQVPVSKIN